MISGSTSEFIFIQIAAGLPALACAISRLMCSTMRFFRLTGDTNPLHIDPERAKVAGFPRPILHGMAGFGVAAHAILRMLADYQPEKLASIEARFAKPIFPGETVRTEMWQNGLEVAFRCRTIERGEVAIDNGLARLR